MPFVDHDGRPTHYEVRGPDGSLAAPGAAPVDPVLVMGGWGTFTGDDFREVPRGVAQGRTVVTFDWPGLGRSVAPERRGGSTRDLARAAAAVLDASGVGAAPGGVHAVGIVGVGACVAQWLAVDRPDLVRSLAVSGGWAAPDRTFVDQMENLRAVFHSAGFAEFQRLCALWSFDPGFYAEHADRVLGPDGAWKHLADRPALVDRLIDATVGHDALARLPEVRVPTFVLHAGADLLTGPRLTLPVERAVPGARGLLWADLPHVVAGRAAKTRFSALLDGFLREVEAGTG